MRRGHNVSEIERVLGGFKLTPNATGVVGEIHRRGYRVAIITGGLDVLAEKVAGELGIQHVFANGLEVDERGHLTGEGIFRVEPRFKHEVLKKLAGEFNLSLRECVGIGDSKYDVNFLKHVGLGVAIGESPELARVADVVIRDFEHFPQLLDSL